MQILKQVRKIAQQHTEEKGKIYKEQFDKNAQPHDFKVDDLVQFSEYNFLGINKKLGPAVAIVQVALGGLAPGAVAAQVVLRVVEEAERENFELAKQFAQTVCNKVQTHNY